MKLTLSNEMTPNQENAKCLHSFLGIVSDLCLAHPLLGCIYRADLFIRYAPSAYTKSL